MKVAEFFTSPAFWLTVNVSAAGSYFACKTWAARLWFFLIAPPLYAMLWLIVGAILVVPLGFDRATHTVVTMAVTLGLYALNCAMLHGDGERGLRMMGSGGLGGRKGGGGDTISLPPSASQRRWQLK